MSLPTPAAADICVYPLSPTYQVLHRYLYYSAIMLSVLYPRPPPLVKGAFAYSLTYSSGAALYAILQLALPADGPLLNLDVFALWAILAAASTLLLPLLTWSRNLQGAGSRSARPIIRLWGGLLILPGTICAFVLLARARTLASDPPASIDCPSLLANVSLPALRLRNPEHVLGGDQGRIFGALYDLLYARLSPLVFIPLGFGAVSCLVTLMPPASREATSSWDGRGGIALDLDATAHSTYYFLRNAFLHLRSLVMYLTPAWFLPVLVVNEMYLLQDWPLVILESEKMYEVGQWGLYAGLGLVSAAAAVNAFCASREKSGRKAWGLGGDASHTVV